MDVSNRIVTEAIALAQQHPGDDEREKIKSAEGYDSDNDTFPF